jgi:hypothetical protein
MDHNTDQTLNRHSPVIHLRVISDFLSKIDELVGTRPEPGGSGSQFAPDSPLEGSGFELLVPLVDAGLFGRTGRK